MGLVSQTFFSYYLAILVLQIVLQNWEENGTGVGKFIMWGRGIRRVGTEV